VPTKHPPIHEIDPFKASADEESAWNAMESAIGPEATRPRDPNAIMSESTAFEYQRSVRALGCILMRVERVNVEMTTAIRGMTKALEENTAELKKHPSQRRSPLETDPTMDRLAASSLRRRADNKPRKVSPK
jgi:hypothetical protein